VTLVGRAAADTLVEADFDLSLEVGVGDETQPLRARLLDNKIVKILISIS
jgi:hypothetical protein